MNLYDAGKSIRAIEFVCPGRDISSKGGEMAINHGGFYVVRFFGWQTWKLKCFVGMVFGVAVPFYGVLGMFGFEYFYEVYRSLVKLIISLIIEVW